MNKIINKDPKRDVLATCSRASVKNSDGTLSRRPGWRQCNYQCAPNCAKNAYVVPSTTTATGPSPGPGHHVVRAATVEPPARKSHDNCDCECLDPVASKEALVGLRKFCASFELPHNMTWAADATCGVGGRYAVPPDFDRFCALHQPFADAADGRAQCQLFLQRLALSSRPEPAVLCELACEGWCDPCCPVGTPGMSCG